jgi:hypothetical protein
MSTSISGVLSQPNHMTKIWHSNAAAGAVQEQLQQQALTSCKPSTPALLQLPVPMSIELKRWHQPSTVACAVPAVNACCVYCCCCL